MLNLGGRVLLWQPPGVQDWREGQTQLLLILTAQIEQSEGLSEPGDIRNLGQPPSQCCAL